MAAKKKDFDLNAALAARQTALLANDALSKLVKLDRIVKGEDMVMERVPCIPTGFSPLDIALAGGVPIGRATMIYGQENSGKTTLLHRIIASAQQMCFTCYKYISTGDCQCDPEVRRVCGVGVIDIEGTMNAGWMMNAGVLVEHLLYFKPENAEEACEQLDKLLESGLCDLIVFDSIAQLVPKSTLEHEFQNEKAEAPAMMARMIGTLTKKLAARNNSQAMTTGNKTTLVMTNQLRMKVGVVYGNPETYPGGNSLKYVCDLMVRLAGKIKKDEKTEEIIANEVHFSITKTKFPVLQAGDFCIQLLQIGEKGMGSPMNARLLRLMAENFGYMVKAKGGWQITLAGMETLELKSRDQVDVWLDNPENERNFVRAFMQTLLTTRGMLKPGEQVYY